MCLSCVANEWYRIIKSRKVPLYLIQVVFRDVTGVEWQQSYLICFAGPIQEQTHLLVAFHSKLKTHHILCNIQISHQQHLYIVNFQENYYLSQLLHLIIAPTALILCNSRKKAPIFYWHISAHHAKLAIRLNYWQHFSQDQLYILLFSLYRTNSSLYVTNN